MAETLFYLQDFRIQGVTELVVTPHLLLADLRPEGIDEVLSLHRARYTAVQEHIAGIPALPEVFLGQEILARSPRDIEGVLGRSDVGLAGGASLLVEFGFQPGFDGDGIIEAVMAEGRTIIVAHPERYDFGDEDYLGKINVWKDRGALIQLNGGSLLGLYTDLARQRARELLQESLVDLVCTDHHGDNRPHPTDITSEAVAIEVGWTAVDTLMSAGPRRALGLRVPFAPDPLQSPAGSAA